MSLSLRIFLISALFSTLPGACFAQLTVPPTLLTVSDELPVVQAAAFTTISDPQCSRDGSIFLRHESSNESSWEVMKISPDGSTQQTTVASVPGFGDMHTFTMAIRDGGAVDEIVRARADGGDGTDPSIYYVQFDSDGSFRSKQRLSREFISAVLVPFPSGNFFSAGVMVSKAPGKQDVEEVPVAGVFDSNATLLSTLGQNKPRLQRISATDSGDDGGSDAEALQQGGYARVGDDGDLYVLLNSSGTRVRVFRQSGEFRREMNLQQPFQEGLATGLWVSSGRLLVSYEGEADDPKDAVTYILYDARTGELIRAYRPQFSGMVACFEDGQDLTVLVKELGSGRLKIGSVELQ
jgi:hypothetical protein